MSHETGGGEGGAAKEAVSNGVSWLESIFNWVYNWWWSLFEGGGHHH